MSGSAIVNGILLDTLKTAGLVGLALATLAGLALVLAPGRALALAMKLNREFSVSWLQRLLDEPRRAEPLVYRNHKTVGVALVLATAYFFWRFMTDYDEAALVGLFAGTLPPVVLELLATVVTVVLVLGNVAGFVLGVVVFVRPSLLKGAESWANRWIASDRATEMLDRRIGGPENFAHRYPRRVGALILFAVTYIALIAAIIIK